MFNTPTQGGQRGTVSNIVERIRALRVPQSDVRVNVSSMGGTQLPLTTVAIAMGCHVRVGMGDDVFYRYGELVETNAQLVERTVRIASELHRQPATPDEARAILATHGLANGKARPERVLEDLAEREPGLSLEGSAEWSTLSRDHRLASRCRFVESAFTRSCRLCRACLSKRSQGCMQACVCKPSDSLSRGPGCLAVRSSL